MNIYGLKNKKKSLLIEIKRLEHQEHVTSETKRKLKQLHFQANYVGKVLREERQKRKFENRKGK